MQLEKAEECLRWLKERASVFNAEKISNHVLADHRFFTWSGSGDEKYHHYGDHGLICHTYEVVRTSLNMAEFYKKEYKIDTKELFLAALFHDAGKMHDYARRGTDFNAMPKIEDGKVIHPIVWESTQHKRRIHHISRSAIIWHEACIEDPKIYDKYFEPVLHAILSHHGLREWGSPVAPNTRVAWLLHLCDGISARMYDCDTRDLVKGK